MEYLRNHPSQRLMIKGLTIIQIDLEFRNAGFFNERRKPKYTKANLSERGREPTTNLTHMTLGPGIEPGAHWWEASMLATAPTLLL